MMETNRVYLDHAGAALPSESQLNAIGHDLLQMRLSNPHSRHPTSIRTRDIINAARNRILRHFNTSSDEFSVVFTLNATHALKMVAECFQFGEHQQDCKITNTLANCPGGVFVYMRDGHTSVVGMRELTRQRCNQICAVDFCELTELPARQPDEKEPLSRDLFVITAMSNFCGRKYPLYIIDRIHRWRPGRSFVCLDAASWVSTSFLDLSTYKPDFVTISLYKMLGYPTGVGALLVRNDRCDLLQKNYFGGGTVNLADHDQFIVHHKADFVEKFEDGTVDFYGIAALERGFDDIDSHGGIKAVQQHTFALALRAFRTLSSRTHMNGKHIAEVYCADPDYGISETQGPIVAFNLLHDNGSYVGYTEVEKMCDLFEIDLRSGCFCNQGACQIYLQIPRTRLIANYEKGKVCGDSMDIIDGCPVGALRISFGRQSNEHDVELFEKMLDTCFVSSPFLCAPPKNGIIYEPKLTDIFIYPIKSCSPIKAERWQVGTSGFQYDRQWTVISREGSVLTQKRYPRLCSIRPQIEDGKLILTKKRDENDMRCVSVPLRRYGNGLPEHRRICVHRVRTIDCGDEVAEWMDIQLGENGCRLHRVFDEQPTSDSISSIGKSLSNEAPYLLINRCSANYLAEMVGLKVEQVVKRFRANLIIDDMEAFSEDKVTAMSIGDVQFKVVGRCSRCQMICIDQENGEKNANLLVALRDYRQGSKATFGIYLQLEKSSEGAILQIGMPISYTS